jgi:sialidase-1
MLFRLVFYGVVGCGWMSTIRTAGAEPSARLEIDEAARTRCVNVLRSGLGSDEFWPSMHAAEGLTLEGHGQDVRRALAPKLTTETDDQKRCGLARELVRAGDLAPVQVMLDILTSRNPYGHDHAAESLFKIGQIGDGTALRSLAERLDRPSPAMMAASALARWGNRDVLKVLRHFVAEANAETARIAAWALARTGDQTDLPALRTGLQRHTDPISKAYFEHALAALGDDAGLAALIRNLDHANPEVRVMAAEFAPDARAVAARDALLRHLDDPVLDVRVRSAHALLVLSKPAPPPRDEDISRNVFRATEAHPRYTEGSIIVLRDGRLLYATTEFSGTTSDFAAARIVAVESADGGRTWSAPRVVQENVGGLNVMSATLRRLLGPARFDGPIGLFYLIKNATNDLQVYWRVSDDEGATFGSPRRITAEPGYHVLNNDRITVLSRGRLIVPIASTTDVHGANKFACSCYFSDDQGRTWKRSRGEVSYPQRGAMEPEVLELSDGRLLMHIRTQLGHLAVSESTDGGESWSAARSWGVLGPESPATLRRIPSTGHLLLIWNDTDRNTKFPKSKRTPLTAAVSTDEGRTWSFKRDLETSEQHTYAYTSVAFFQGRALLTYWVSDDATRRYSARFRSVPIAWFYENGATRRSELSPR